MMILVAKSASDYLRHHDALEALREFVKPDSKFMRGDIEVFVIDTSGICLAAGDDYNLIWKNLMEAKDDTGKPYIKFMINTIVKTKTGVITFKRHGATCVAYNELVEKEGKLYLVGSSFYL
jgi:cytochrome c